MCVCVCVWGGGGVKNSGGLLIILEAGKAKSGSKKSLIIQYSNNLNTVLQYNSAQ